ncbi:MAG: ribonuclease J, partial [Patescibacteria group bacterium]
MREYKKKYHHQKHSNEKIRIIPLGGAEEIGRNMTVVEYGDDIIVIDAGLQFPEEETPGIDYIVPNTKYLESRKNKIRCLIISHGHLDHVGAIPYIIDRLGNPIIYTTKLTKAMILKRQEEFPHSLKLNIEEMKSSQNVKIGKNLKLRFFDITHTIPDAIGTIIESPLGNIIYPGDFKIERDKSGKLVNVEQFVRLGKEKNLVLLMESTNAEQPGFSISENTVRDTLEKIFKEAGGRIIISTFASQIERIIEIIKIAENLGKKVAIDGFSLKANIEIAKELGFFKPKKNIMITIDTINHYSPEKIIVICTGAQGEEKAALMRIANRKHKYVKIQKGDTAILSSSIIPGNEKSIQNLKDNLSRQG